MDNKESRKLEALFQQLNNALVNDDSEVYHNLRQELELLHHNLEQKKLHRQRQIDAWRSYVAARHAARQQFNQATACLEQLGGYEMTPIFKKMDDILNKG